MTSALSNHCQVIFCCALLLAPLAAGCRWLKVNDTAHEIEKAVAEAEPKAPAAKSAAAASSPADTMLSRDGWNAALAPQPPFPSSAGRRWRHGDLESLLPLPADQRPDFTAALTESDPVTATNAAICLARLADGRGREQLAQAVRLVRLRRPLRCAAAEALASIHAPAATEDLRALVDELGRGPTGMANYAPELHAELLYGLAERVDAANDARFAAALKSEEPAVRLAAIRAFTVPGGGPLPMIGADLRSDEDHRIRAAALEAMVVRRHELALESVRTGLNDYRLEVRLAAIACLGSLDKTEAAVSLRQLEHEPEAIRSAAVLAWAKLGDRDAVWRAANDDSWRLRKAAAEAIAGWPDAKSAALARRLMKDSSTEVQKAAVASAEKWPEETAVPVLFAALQDGGYMTRKMAARQLSERWPEGASFTVDAPPERRAEMLAALRKNWGEAHPLPPDASTVDAPAAASPAQRLSVERLQQLERIVRRIQEAPPTGGAMGLALREMDEFGPDLLPALERLVLERHVVLPDVVFRDVLAKRGQDYEALDRLASSESVERRQAALKLAELAETNSLSWLALLRLAELGAGEQDTLVWNSMMRAVARDPREPAMRLAYAGLTHQQGEVRRLACEYLAAFPAAEHAAVLLPALEDKHRPVVMAAIHALGHPGMLDDAKPLERLLTTNDRELRLAVAQSLIRLGAPSGQLELQRLAHDPDPEIRRQAAVVMGAFGDPAYLDDLIDLLNDTLGVQVAALDALPKVAGRDAAQQPGNPASDTRERISRWKRWHDAERRKAEGATELPTAETERASTAANQSQTAPSGRFQR